MKKLSYYLIILCLAAACSSNKKKDAESAAVEQYPEQEAVKEGDFELMLNGDSDSRRAGAMRTVYFAYNSSLLSEPAKDALQNNAEYLKNNTGVEVQIEGHCDERGGVQFNLALGERRAKSVKSYLMAMGVNGNRLSTVSYGKERPLEFGHSESAWSKNRRGNFVVTAK